MQPEHAKVEEEDNDNCYNEHMEETLVRPKTTGICHAYCHTYCHAVLHALLHESSSITAALIAVASGLMVQ